MFNNASVTSQFTGINNFADFTLCLQWKMNRRLYIRRWLLLPVRCHFDSVYRVVIAGTAQVEQMTLMATVFSASVSLILFQRGGAYDTGRQGTPIGEKKKEPLLMLLITRVRFRLVTTCQSVGHEKRSTVISRTFWSPTAAVRRYTMLYDCEALSVTDDASATFMWCFIRFAEC